MRLLPSLHREQDAILELLSQYDVEMTLREKAGFASEIIRLVHAVAQTRAGLVLPALEATGVDRALCRRAAALMREILADLERSPEGAADDDRLDAMMALSQTRLSELFHGEERPDGLWSAAAVHRFDGLDAAVGARLRQLERAA